MDSSSTSSVQLGLCCINTELQAQGTICSRTMRLDTLLTKGLPELYKRARANCQDLIKHIQWNADHGIRVFRISSDLFPHKSNPKAPEYSLDFATDLLKSAGELARSHRQRLTFHPGQFNVVGTPHKEAFDGTVRDLDWQAEVLDIMGCDQDSVMVVHGGGVYGNKRATIERWIANFKLLPERVRRRLVLENCEKSFSITDCLQVAGEIDIPVVFDSHHFACYQRLHPETHFDAAESYLPAILETWHRRNIKPKFHVSEQCPDKQIGAHSDYISEIPDYLLEIPAKYGVDIDIMVEAKMKEKAISQLYIRHPQLNPDVRRPSKIKLKLRKHLIPLIPAVEEGARGNLA